MNAADAPGGEEQLPDDLMAQAAEWCARMDNRDLTPAEDLELRGWLADDPRRRAALESISRMMSDPALTVALRSVDRQHATAPIAMPAATDRRDRTKRLGAILVGVFMLIGTAWFVSAWLDPVPPTLAFSTAPGETSTVPLEDGSSIQLSGDTLLEVQMEPSRRVVRMQRGEAFFTIARDSARPFIVTVANARVQVVGTAFDLSETRDGLEVSVHHGRVNFGHDGEFAAAIELNAGERAYIRNSTLSAAMPFDPAAGDWRTGWLQTESVTLGGLAQRLSRRFGVEISVAPALADKRIAGRFRLDNSEKLLRVLSAVHGFEVQRAAGGLALLEPTQLNSSSK